MSFNDLVSAIGPVLPDNTSTALEIEGVDAKDYIQVDTTDGGESITLGQKTIITGIGGASGDTAPATGGATPTLVLDNGTANSANRCTLYMNSSASGGSQIDMYQAGDRKLLFMATASEQVIVAEDTLIIRNEADTARMSIADSLVEVHSQAKITGPGGTTGDAAPTGAAAPTLYLESSTGNSQDRCALLMNGDGNSGSNIDLQYQGNQKLRISATDTVQAIVAEDVLVIQSEDDTARLKIGPSNITVESSIHFKSGTGSDTATTEPVYLADTNGTMIVDFDKGNFGDITLAANVTAVKFFNAPADGTVATITAKITQDSSVRTFDYGDSAVTVYSDGGSTAVTGEIKFAGGAHHVQSTGSGAVDLVSFTCIPSGSTFNIYAAVIGQAFA